MMFGFIQQNMVLLVMEESSQGIPLRNLLGWIIIHLEILQETLLKHKSVCKSTCLFRSYVSDPGKINCSR